MSPKRDTQKPATPALTGNAKKSTTATNANQDGKVVCLFTAASKFHSRYATPGFNDHANLDEGVIWATSFAPKELTAAEEARLSALVKKAVD